MSAAVISFQWFFWGYSLAFSHTAGKYIGDLENIGFRNVLAAPSVGSAKVPDLLFAIYQCMFAAITPALAIGAAADRGRMLPCVVFMFIWSTIIYDPIACWTWNPAGWGYKLGGLDFAGGTPVHISSGAAALAYSVMLGKRTGYHSLHGLPYRPHNVTHVVLGTVFLWVGWFGFNGGSALGANLRAVMACVVTHIAASVGGWHSFNDTRNTLTAWKGSLGSQLTTVLTANFQRSVSVREPLLDWSPSLLRPVTYRHGVLSFLGSSEQCPAIMQPS